MSKKYSYEDKDFKLIQGDSFKILKGIEFKSIDIIFADSPYFLFSEGISCSNEKWYFGKFIKNLSLCKF